MADEQDIRQQCIFCQIIDGKIPSKKVFEDEKVIAVLDINPATAGHVLIMPKEHFSIMPQLNDEILKSIFSAAKKISNAMLKSMQAQGTTIFIANGLAAGQRAQHFMIHVIPRFKEDGFPDIPKNKTTDKELEEIWLKIKG
jgi:histidine triad (HIT) family protein